MTIRILFEPGLGFIFSPAEAALLVGVLKY